jgi:hypothetical protein
VVAQPEAVDLPLLVGDADHAAGADVLLVVAPREALLGVLGDGGAVVVHGLAAPHRGHAPIVELDGGVDPRVLGERPARARHLERALEQGDLSGVRDALLLERLDDVEPHPTGVERVIVGDLGPAEHETDPPVGEVDARRHLGVALVGPVAEAGPAADAVGGGEEVEVHRLVEVLGRFQRVHVLVGRLQAQLHARHATRP